MTNSSVMSNSSIVSGSTGLMNSSAGQNSLNIDLEFDLSFSSLFQSLIDSVVEQSGTAKEYGMTWERFGPMISYCCSLYGVSCLLVTVILNRTMVLASSNIRTGQQQNRQKLVYNLKKGTVFGLRALTIIILLNNLWNCLIVLKLTGVNSEVTPWYVKFLPDNLHNYDSENVWFAKYIPKQLFGYNPDDYPANSYMATPKDSPTIGPSTVIYWSVFLGACLLVFVETFSSTILGEKRYVSAGFTLFELSAGFHEQSSAAPFLPSLTIHKPTEGLVIICIYLILCHLNNHVGSIINNNKYRLIPLTILGIGLLGYFANSIRQHSTFDISVPCVMALFPQLVTCIGVLVAGVIFLLAIIANGFDIGALNYGRLFFNEDDNISPQERFNVGLDDDFLTALVSFGQLAVTLAGKSCYITELSLVNVEPETYIERSIWTFLKSQVRSFRKLPQDRRPNRDNLLAYLKDHKISGYNNIITNPSKRLLSDGSYNIDDDDLEYYNEFRVSNMSIHRKRFVFVTRIYINLIQLIKGLVIDKFIRSYIPYLVKVYILRIQLSGTFRKNMIETDDEFEARKQSVPTFLRRYVRKLQPVESVIPSPVLEDEDSAKVQLGQFTDQQLRNEYVSILQGEDIAEIDESEDFLENAESELEIESDFSDIESIDLTQSVVNSARRPNPSSDNIQLAINELFTPQGLQEFIQSPLESSVLQKHLTYDGILTRSKYNKMVKSAEDVKDEAGKLLELIIEKRGEELKDILDGKELPKEHKKIEDDGDSIDDFADSKFDCVICQTNTREIITWPCRCFAICESCRLSLVSKGMEGCVCCRRDVEGVSKVFVP